MRENADQKNLKFRNFLNIDVDTYLSVDTLFSEKSNFYFNDFVSKCDQEVISQFNH